MFNKDNNIAGIETVIGLVTEELEKATPGSEEFSKIAEQLERLNKIAASRKSEPISRNAVIAVIGNLLGIGVILQHERLNTITTKALSFVGKFRL